MTPNANTLFKELRTVDDESPSLPVVIPESSVSMFERLARDPGVDVDKLERLMAMWERSEALRAQSAFNSAMSDAQDELRPVAADAENPQTRSRYASYTALDNAVRPVYTKHGFALSFDTADSPLPEHVRIVCYVSHRAGHNRTHHVDMPADGKGAKGGDVMTKTHAAGAAMSYGQRYLLKLIFNIAVGEDRDGNAPRNEPKKTERQQPEGYDAWFATLEGIAANGMKEFDEAWGKSKEDYRKYLASTAPKVLASLKTKAAKAGVRR